jgi:hypothetical protein
VEYFSQTGWTGFADLPVGLFCRGRGRKIALARESGRERIADLTLRGCECISDLIPREPVAGGRLEGWPHNLQPLLESGILLCALVAVLLNAFFNGVGSSAAAEAEAATAAASAQHV